VKWHLASLFVVLGVPMAWFCVQTSATPAPPFSERWWKLVATAVLIVFVGIVFVGGFFRLHAEMRVNELNRSPTEGRKAVEDH
jgi:hypothetical protein